MGLGDPLGDRQSEAGSGLRAHPRAGRIAAPEAIEDIRKVAWRYPYTGVAYLKHNVAAAVVQLHRDCPARRRVLHRVGDQVEKELSNPIPVHIEEDRVLRN